MNQLLRNLARGNKPAVIGYIIFRSWLNRSKFISGNISYEGGNTTVRRPIEDSVDYVRASFNDFVTYGELGEPDIAGKRYLELGPGDNVGVGLLFLAKGASEYICVDKFFPPHDQERERQLYLRLREGLSSRERERMDEAVELGTPGKPVFNEKKIRYIYGIGGEEADRQLDSMSFDAIISRGVLQGVDTERFFQMAARLLKPGGLTVHKVDLRDHGMLSGNGFHPLEFLTISEPVYQWMVKDTDRPNRRHFNYYRQRFQEHGFEGKIYRCGLIYKDYSTVRDINPYKLEFDSSDCSPADLELARAIRPRLLPKYRDLSDHDLLTSGIFISMRHKGTREESSQKQVVRG